MEADPVPVPDGARPQRVVGIAASAGGVEAIRRVVGELPADFPAAICVTLHIPATGRSLLAPIPDRDSPMLREPVPDPEEGLARHDLGEAAEA